jgi:tRNA pseudouridine55 synthase
MTGLLLVAKPTGPTSYDLIRWVKRIVPKGVKIGHCGTLDPMATGLMILLFGRAATKIQDTLMHQPKTYRGSLRRGIQTDSGDVTGSVIDQRPVPAVDSDRWNAIASEMIGAHTQIPPMYSAIKLNGTPLYKLARKGEIVERKPRSITITHFEWLERADADASFRVRCSSGTYVRTLAEDLGRRLGTVATLSALEREEVGGYHVRSALPADALRHLSLGELERKLTPVPA